MVNEGLTQWGNIELAIQGSRGKCEFMLDDTDLEGERLIAEYDQLEASARHTQAQADETYIRMGVVSRQEVRETLIGNDDRYTDLVVGNLPPEPVANSQPVGSPDPEPAPEE